MVSNTCHDKYLKLNKETHQFLNIVFLYSAFKLQEYQQSYQMASDLARDMQKKPLPDS